MKPWELSDEETCLAVTGRGSGHTQNIRSTEYIVDSVYHPPSARRLATEAQKKVATHLLEVLENALADKRLAMIEKLLQEIVEWVEEE